MAGQLPDRPPDLIDPAGAIPTRLRKRGYERPSGQHCEHPGRQAENDVQQRLDPHGTFLDEADRLEAERGERGQRAAEAGPDQRSATRWRPPALTTALAVASEDQRPGYVDDQACPRGARCRGGTGR